jgi:hypothetical protein
VGDTINGAVLDAGGSGTALSILPEASGSSVRRFSVRNALSEEGYTEAGIAVYGAEVTLSNLLLEDCRTGILLNEVPLAQIENITVDASAVHAIASRHSSFTLSNAVFSGTGRVTGGCPIYREVGDGAGDSISYSGSVGPPQAGCSGVSELPAPVYWDVPHFYLDTDCVEGTCPDNTLYVGGGDPNSMDVDGSSCDRGVYGGPRGEVHYPDLLLPAPEAVMTAAALGLWVFWRRRASR